MDVNPALLSGTGIDTANGIALDANEDAIVVGSTRFTDFPITSGALQTNKLRYMHNIP
jgi:hypothetical protein